VKKISLGIGIAVLVSSTGALAGYVYQPGVTIWSNNASGTVAGTRYSSDSIEQIGCELDAWPGTATQGYCFAKNSAGQWKTCISYDPNLVAAAGTVGPASYIQFAVASDNYYCSSLIVQNSAPALR
jgi:hypothetical protein